MKLNWPRGNRYQCRYPNCGRLYLSTDAARKHCRKSHFNWLRGLDEKVGASAHARSLTLAHSLTHTHAY
eukprot:4592192-Pleurochrysis_carterae.AAC.3